MQQPTYKCPEKKTNFDSKLSSAAGHDPGHATWPTTIHLSATHSDLHGEYRDSQTHETRDANSYQHRPSFRIATAHVNEPMYHARTKPFYFISFK